MKDEYISRYLEGNIGQATWAESRHRQPTLIDHVPEDNGPLSPLVISRLPPLDVTPEEAQQLGYKPHRDDYERVSLVLCFFNDLILFLRIMI